MAKAIKKANFYILLSTIFLILIIVMLILSPAKYINSCYNGLLIWATTVLPSLLPFFVITKLLAELNSLNTIFDKFAFVNKKLFNAEKISGYIFCMSIISGYPVGAKLICDAYENGQISSRQANKLITFCSTSGPLFIIGTVGAIMLGSAKYGYILYFSHILSAILNGILYRKCYLNCEKQPQKTNGTVDYSNLLNSVMTSSISSVMIVGGFVAIFYMIIDIMLDVKLLSPLSSLIDTIFNFCGVKVGSAISSGIVEVTRGCRQLSLLNLPTALKLTLCSSLITFGGMSVHFQSLAFLTRAKVNVKFYFLQKITQTIFACALCYLLCLIML